MLELIVLVLVAAIAGYIVSLILGQPAGLIAFLALLLIVLLAAPVSLR